MKRKKTGYLTVLMLFAGLFLFAHTAHTAQAAKTAKTVYSVDRYGELYDYSGNPVVTLKSNISAVHKNAFNDVRTTRFVTSGNPYFKTIDGVLYSKDGTQLIKCPSEKQGSLTVPSSVKKIAHSAFEDCTGLTRITIPDSVRTIEEQAFYNCSGLQQVRLPSHLTKMKNELFCGCSSLTEIEIPDSVTAIGNKVFYNCQVLGNVRIPDSVSSVGYRSFFNCISLRSVRLSKKMTFMDEHLFENCTELRKIENTEGIEKIGWRACKNCVKLNTFSFSDELEYIGGQAFYNCEELGTVVILGGVRHIDRSAFTSAAGKFIVDASNANYSSRNGMLLNEEGNVLIQAPVSVKGHLDIPKSVLKIAEDALYNGKYSSITIPEGVTSIHKSLFLNCERLKWISLPASVENISWYYGQDYHLDNLERISVARGNNHYCSIDGVVYSYDMKQMVFYPTGKKGVFNLPDRCKSIRSLMQRNKLSAINVAKTSKYFSSLDGVLYNKKMTEICCFPMEKKSYRIPEKVKSISYLNTIKKDLKCKAVSVSSKNNKFTAKAGVVFNRNADTLLFYPTKKKGAYKIPASTTYISSGAFDEAHKLTSLTITKNVKRTRSSTFHFKNCKKLKKIVVNQGKMNYISMNFTGCNKLSTLTFPSTIMTTDLSNLPQGVTIHGWKNTYAKEAAEEAKGTFISRGTIPNVVSGVRVKKIIDRYQLSWNPSSEASGYQVYTVSDTIKVLKGSGNTSCFIADRYTEDMIYIRAYKIVNKKKVYGKARRVSIG